MKMKKTLAILLSLALVICMIPGAAFATEGSGEPAPVSAPAAAEVTLSSTTAEYNAAVQQPSVTGVKVNGEAVTGYTVTYGEGFKDKGVYTVTVTGTLPAAEGAEAVAYEGTAQFTITALDINSSKVNIIVPDQASGATAVTGEKFVYNGYQTAAFANDYTVTVSGTKATFTGSGNLTGSREVTFKTVPTLASAFTATGYKTSAYDGTEKAVSVYLSAKSGYAYIASSSYEVTPKTVVAAGTHEVTVTAKEGSGYAGSITTTVTVPARDASLYNVTVADIPNQGYTGGQIRPSLTVTDYLGGKTVTLVAGQDYYVTYGTNKAIGTNSGSATLTFMGNYTGTRTVYFDIIDPTKDVGSAYVSVTNNGIRTYTGYRDEPNYVVTLGAKTLTRNSQYEIVYTDDATGISTTSPVNAGTYTVTVRGIGTYGGEQVLAQKYVINARNIGDATISGLYDSYTYAGVKVEPTFSVYYPYGTLLTKGSIYGDGDYYVTYGSNSTTGTSAGVIYIHGNGNFTGTKVVRFGIAGKSIAGCSAYFTNGVSSSAYTGVAAKPAITVRDGYYTTLRQNIDYTVSYKDSLGKVVTSMKDAGTYTVVITGKGNYSGELNLTYTITGKDISYYTVTLSKNSVNATGTAQKPTVTSVKYGTTALKSTDYTVTYQNSLGQTVTSMTAPDTYRVVITGKGGYSGSTYATFRIVGTPQEIKIAKTAYKVYEDTDAFKLTGISSTGDGTGYSYVSSDPTVASVSATGVVTVHKLGRAKITVTTTGMKKSDPASDDVYIKVYPDKAQLSKKPWTEDKKGSLRVRWDKQEGVTYYEVRYSRDKSFASGTYKTKKVNASTLDYTTQSTRISGLKSGYKYYVKVRAVKVVYNDYGQELKYYGKWSNWKSRVTK